MQFLARLLVPLGMCLAVSLAAAQTPETPATGDIVRFSATATLDAPQDELTITLAATRDGADARTVQAQLKSALEAALAEARRAAEPGVLEVRSGDFQLQPRRERDGRIGGWQGTGELVLSGSDSARVAELAGRLRQLTVTQLVFSLSRAQREQLEVRAQAQAISRFRARAAEVAHAFGFASWRLRDATLSTQAQGTPPVPRLAMMAAGSLSAEAPVPVQAGRSSVQVTVHGSVQLLK